MTGTNSKNLYGQITGGLADEMLVLQIFKRLRCDYDSLRDIRMIGSTNNIELIFSKIKRKMTGNIDTSHIFHTMNYRFHPYHNFTLAHFPETPGYLPS
jgi:hypothetical protein